MTSRPGFTTAILIISLILASFPVLAEDEFKLTPNNSVRRLLVSHLGQVVTLQTASGKELTGKVTTIGEHLVQLSEISGREYYDAMVDYDHIEAVIVNVRNK